MFKLVQWIMQIHICHFSLQKSFSMLWTLYLDPDLPKDTQTGSKKKERNNEIKDEKAWSNWCFPHTLTLCDSSLTSRSGKCWIRFTNSSWAAWGLSSEKHNGKITLQSLQPFHFHFASLPLTRPHPSMSLLFHFHLSTFSLSPLHLHVPILPFSCLHFSTFT